MVNFDLSACHNLESPERGPQGGIVWLTYGSVCRGLYYANGCGKTKCRTGQHHSLGLGFYLHNSIISFL